MSILTHTRRPIGRILLDGGFLSRSDLELALEEQKQTNELLGQTLVRMGLLGPADLQAALSVQGYLASREDAVKTAAGVRQMLGDLLLQAGHITKEQLEHALTEQKRSGERLGEVLVRRGLLTGQQLDAVLDFQQNQGAARRFPGPIRLGELLVSTGIISREQLADALQKQTGSGKKLGEVLIEEGYVQSQHIRRGIRLQQMLVTAALVALLTACGGGGGSTETYSDVAVSNTQQEQVQSNYLTLTSDEYGLLTPNFYYSTENPEFWSIQSAVAHDVYDPDFKTIIRIEIAKSGNGMPDIAGKVFSIEDAPNAEKFPGAFFVFNGQQSVQKKVEHGTISFAPGSTASGNVQGTFDVILTDYDSPLAPSPQFHLTGVFSFLMGTHGPAQ